MKMNKSIDYDLDIIEDFIKNHTGDSDSEGALNAFDRVRDAVSNFNENNKK